MLIRYNNSDCLNKLKAAQQPEALYRPSLLYIKTTKLEAKPLYIMNKITAKPMGI